MINKKGKRKVEYGGQTYYWYVKKQSGVPRIRILSADKKTQLNYGFDKEVPVSNRYIKNLLDLHFAEDLCNE